MKPKYSFIGICFFNTEVDCIKKDNCAKCGWNPEVEKVRKEKNRKKLEDKK